MNFEIGCVLETNESFQLNVGSVVTGRTFVASITRWGKSWTCRKIIEECFGHAGMILVDPEGEYWSQPSRLFGQFLGSIFDSPVKKTSCKIDIDHFEATQT